VPSHEISSAALVRGHLHGVEEDVGFPVEVFRVPAMVGDPNPYCYALHEDVPAGCAPPITDSTALTSKDTTSGRYPIWGGLLPGVASFAPWPSAYVYLARLFAAAVPWLLVGGALVRAGRASWTFAAAAALGLTPIAWFSFSIVNPSGVAIAGGFALWIGLLAPRPAGATDWLTLAGWWAVLLPRRDGPVWATLTVICVCLATAQMPGDLWRRQSRAVRWATLLALPVAMLAVRHPGRARRFLERSTYLVLAVPGVVIALALSYFTERYLGGFGYQTAPLLILAYAIMFFPLALVGVKASLARAPVSLDEVARSLGQPRLAVLCRITLRLTAPGLTAAFCLVFLSVITELTATLILIPTGVQTLASQFWVYETNLSYGQAAPFALVMIAVAAIPSWVLGRFFNRGAADPRMMT